MALILKDRVQETTTTTGTGTLTLGGAVTGYQAFTAIGNANTTYYAIYAPGGTEWEVGLGTYTASGTTLSRDVVLASSNSGSLVSFSAGTKNVWCDYPAGKSVYTDANGKATFAGNSYEDFASITAPSYSEGRVWYDSTEKALAYYNDSSNLAVHISQDLIFKVINNTGSTIPNGSPVYITGTSSGQTYPNVALAKADVAATSAVIGLTNGAIANGATGYVSSQGTIDNVNTSTFTVGQVLYLSPYSAGQLMNTIPPTGITVQVGVATYIDSSAGHIYVKQTTPLSVPASIISGTLGVDHGGTGATTLTGYVKGSGTSAMTASSTVPTTDLSGTVTNAQLANSAITINGTSTSLGGSISVGTVTSVTGTSPVVSSGGATPAISMPAATTSVSGYLTSTDWNTFNNKGSGTVTAVSATAPITSSGGATPNLAMPAATGSVNGYLTSTDWTTFNSKGSGTVTSVAASVPSVFSITGSPITSSGTLAITYSGTALPVANGGTNATSASITAFNNITGYTATGATGTTSTNLVFSTSPSITTPTLTTPTVTNYTETTATATGSTSISLANGTVQKITTSGSTTITLPASSSGKSFTVIVAYAAADAITWAGGTTIKWANGTTPTPTSATGKFDIFNFYQDGTNTYGSIFGQNF